MKIEHKVEELPSGSYRVRKQINGKRVSIIFDHKPSESEVMRTISERTADIPVRGSFFTCAESYIESKSNVISPNSIRAYDSLLRNLPESFTKLNLSSITQNDIQLCINEYAVKHAPKSVNDAHGFIYAVIKQFRPSMVINTTLPQKIRSEDYIPSENDIKQILEMSEGTVYHIPIQLGIMSLRISEIMALTLDDIDTENNILTVNKALVRNKDGEYVLKATKTPAGTRKLYIPQKLVDEIMENGIIFDGSQNTCVRALHRYQDKLGIPRFRFHDLRHFFASYAHSQGVSDADIMASGGWKSDYTMKSIYRHEMKQKEAQKKIFDSLI